MQRVVFGCVGGLVDCARAPVSLAYIVRCAHVYGREGVDQSIAFYTGTHTQIRSTLDPLLEQLARCSIDDADLSQRLEELFQA